MNLGVAIAPLDAPDVEAVAAIASDALGSAWSAASVASERARAGAVALSARSTVGSVVGAALGWTVLDELEISVVVVSPAARRRGVGRALLAATLQVARDRGATRAFLEVRASNVPAIALYRAAGFTDAGLRRSYYESGEDALLMAATLAPS